MPYKKIWKQQDDQRIYETLGLFYSSILLTRKAPVHKKNKIIHHAVLRFAKMFKLANRRFCSYLKTLPKTTRDGGSSDITRIGPRTFSRLNGLTSYHSKLVVKGTGNEMYIC